MVLRRTWHYFVAQHREGVVRACKEVCTACWGLSSACQTHGQIWDMRACQLSSSSSKQQQVPQAVSQPRTAVNVQVAHRRRLVRPPAVPKALSPYLQQHSLLQDLRQFTAVH